MSEFKVKCVCVREREKMYAGRVVVNRSTKYKPL